MHLISLKTTVLLSSLCLSSIPTFADNKPQKLPDLTDMISQYQAANQEKYAKLDPYVKQVIADTKTNLAEKMSNPGLQIGEKAPDFSLPNAFGKTVKLSKLLEQGPVIVTFYRGAWCPFCNLQLQAYQRAMPVFKQYNASMVAITPQKPDQSVKQLKKTPLDFEVVSDLDSAVMKAYDLHFMLPEPLYEVYKKYWDLDIAEYNGEGRYELPVPGTFVLDQQGIVRAKFAYTDYTQRMEPRDILEALESIKKK